MTGRTDDMSVAIGQLRADVRHLNKSMIAHQRVTIAEHRRVHDIVDAMAESVRVLGKTVDGLAEKVQRMEPLTEDYRDKRSEVRGAARIGRLLYVGVGGVVGAVCAKAIDLVTIKAHP